MSDVVPAPEPAAAPPPETAAAVAACPITADFLPPNMKKHVDPKAPVPLRMMAAKSLVPLAPPEMLGALFMLTFDPDASVRETAEKTSASLPDRILSAALRDERVPAPVLAFFLERYWQNDSYAEWMILNDSTPDASVAMVASKCGSRTAEIIAQNQLRLLRHEDLVRQLCLNPNATPALLDGVCDFCVRSGLTLADVPQMKEARIRLFGPEAAAQAPDPGPTADEILEEFQSDVADEGAAPMEERKKMNLTQRIMKMNVSQKIKLASKGNKEARGILIRDTNKLVCVAVMRSPRITDGEVLLQASNKVAQEDVLRLIYSSRDWTQDYRIKLALVKNPKVPQAIAMRFIATLRETELRGLARDKNVPNNVRGFAKKLVDKKDEPKKDGGGH